MKGEKVVPGKDLCQLSAIAIDAKAKQRCEVMRLLRFLFRQEAEERISSTTTVFFRLDCRHVVIAIAGFAISSTDFPVWLARIAFSRFAGTENLVGLDFDIRNLAAHSTMGLVNHHLGVLQAYRLPSAPPASKYGPSAGG